MSTVTISFASSTAYKNQDANVRQILRDAGLKDGEYPATKSFPPSYIISSALKKLDNATIDRLRSLNGVKVDVKN